MPRRLRVMDAVPPDTRPVRKHAFGQAYRPTVLDRLGFWLSARKLYALKPRSADISVADLGCGFNATFTRTVLGEVKRAVLIDVRLAEDLKAHPKIVAIEGILPDAMRNVAEQSINFLVCNNVVEHLWEPIGTLRECRRVLAPNGIAFFNVPSWRGKWFLELAAFRLRLSPASEMNDHKMYYDQKDLWPLLVRSGFLPEQITLGSHKFGLNTYAVCRA